MRQFLGLLILLALFLGGKELFSYWEKVRERKRHEGWAQTAAPETGGSTPAAAAAPAPESLPGLPTHLEPSLEAARRQGPDAVKTWLKSNRSQVQDPRLAAIELDYVVMVAGKNFGEAKEVLASVKARTATNSPVYPQVLKLEKSYR